MSEKTVVFVLGMHRSGTSAVSGALASSGVFFGEELLGAEEGVNSKGFWEHRTLVDINEQLLAEAYQRWFYPGAAKEIEKLLLKGVPGEIEERARGFAKELLSLGETCAIKDPRLCLTAPFWKGIFSQLGANIKALHVLRSPKEVCESLFRRDSILTSHASALWLDHVYCAEHFCQKVQSGKLVYADFLEAPYIEMGSIATNLSLDIAPDGDKLSDWVDNSLRHHYPAQNDCGENALLDRAETVFQLVRAAEYSFNEASEEIASLCLLDDEKLDCLSEVAAMFELYNSTLVELMKSNGELARIGEMHSAALGRIGELDAIVEPLNKEKNDAEGRVERLKQELKMTEEKCENIEALLGPWGRRKLKRLR